LYFRLAGTKREGTLIFVVSEEEMLLGMSKICRLFKFGYNKNGLK